MSVVGMLFFFLFIFGVTGTELFAGDYHQARVKGGTSRRGLRRPPGSELPWDCSGQGPAAPHKRCRPPRLPAPQVCVDAQGRLEQSASYLGEFGCGARDCPAGYTCQVGPGREHARGAALAAGAHKDAS
jgi:hypothetical protein